MSTFAVGDKIVIDPEHAPSHLRGAVFEVTKVNPKNVIARRYGVQGRGINYPADVLLKYDGEVGPNGRAATAFSVPIPELFDPGQIVTFKRAPTGHTDATPFVVFKQSGDGKCNVTLLGGDSGRYFRVPASGLVKRDLAWLAGAL